MFDYIFGLFNQSNDKVRHLSLWKQWLFSAALFNYYFLAQFFGDL